MELPFAVDATGIATTNVDHGGDDDSSLVTASSQGSFLSSVAEQQRLSGFSANRPVYYNTPTVAASSTMVSSMSTEASISSYPSGRTAIVPKSSLLQQPSPTPGQSHHETASSGVSRVISSVLSPFGGATAASANPNKQQRSTRNTNAAVGASPHQEQQQTFSSPRLDETQIIDLTPAGDEFVNVEDSDADEVDILLLGDTYFMGGEFGLGEESNKVPIGMGSQNHHPPQQPLHTGNTALHRATKKQAQQQHR